MPFGDADALASQLSSRRFGAFVVEPIQAESGISVPDARYLETAQSLWRRYETLFVLDEVQTGMHRTGPFLTAHHFGLEPDMVVLAKALSGGLVPKRRGAPVEGHPWLRVQLAQPRLRPHVDLQ